MLRCFFIRTPVMSVLMTVRSGLLQGGDRNRAINELYALTACQ